MQTPQSLRPKFVEELKALLVHQMGLQQQSVVSVTLKCQTLNSYDLYTYAIYFAGKAVPFRLEFISDAYEISKASTEGVAAITTDGAKVQFFQTSC